MIASAPELPASIKLDKASCDVLFAHMPYHKLSNPALGASILKTCLENHGISTQITYYSLKFAETIGVHEYQKLENSDPTQLLGEWTFANAAFGAGFTNKRRLEIDQDSCYQNLGITSIHQKIAKIAELWIQHEAKKISKSPPKIIICSSMFEQNLASLAILRAIKAIHPQIKTIMGGPNTESDLGVALLRRAPWLDYICGGEGEETLPQLCLHLLDDEQEFTLPVGVISQNCLSGLDQLKNSVLQRPILSSMDESPEPSFDDYFHELGRTNLNITPGLLLESSRGCWWGQKSHCTFCGLNGEGIGYRAKSPGKMVEILDAKVKEHRIKKIEFVDNIISKSYFNTFLPLLEKKDLSVFYETKADFSERDAAQFLKSGVRFVQPGIESLNDNVLELMRKGTSAAINLECIRLCREYGLRPAWSILSGFPGEDENWYVETAELLPKLYHLPPPGGVVPVRFDRFSPYYDQPSSWNLDLVPYDAYQYIYPESKFGHDDIAYFFKRRGESDAMISRALCQPSIYQQCRSSVRAWKHIWNECRQNQVALPQLTLEIRRGKFNVIDTRNPNQKIVTEVSEQMSDLLIFCRKRKSHVVMNRDEHRRKYGCLNDDSDLLHRAIRNNWIIDISQHFVSIVQVKNNPEPHGRNFPGGYTSLRKRSN